MPEPAKTTVPSVTQAKPLPPTPTAPVASMPTKPQDAPVPTKPKSAEQVDDETQAAVEAVEAAKEAGPAAGTGKGPFVWPVQGKVIGAFGSSNEGLKNDGINIAAPSGAPVVAAADGTVAYAGNELRGFGNMILIRHDGGYVTAYAHNASLLVKKGDKVKRGQTIARVGQTGAVFGPQLHFEIRKGTQPVDPLSFLGG
jgi:murein DD-endopeptidase MepM/ murein hydrolase activator NlpD